MDHEADITHDDFDIAKETQRLHIQSNTTFEGLVTVHFANVIDKLHLGRRQDEIRKLGDKIGEPVLLTMGDKSRQNKINPYIEQLYIPHNDKTVARFSDAIPENGGWLHPIAFNEEYDPIIGTDILERASILSGADAEEEPTFELILSIGQDRRFVEDHLIALGEHGLKISADINGDIISTEQLLAPVNQLEPEM